MTPWSKTIVAIGEALWDVFPDIRRPGGAPCNVAFHAVQIGDRGVIVTRVGEDTPGDELIGFLRECSVDTQYVQRGGPWPTGSVQVTIENSNPRFTVAEHVAWDHLTVDEDVRALVRRADAICVGSLAQRGATTRAAVHELLGEAHGEALIVFDVNLRPPFLDAEVIDDTLHVADVVRMNAAEVAVLSRLLGRRSLTSWLLHDVGVQAVCVTRGPDGASITTCNGTYSTRGISIDPSAGDAVGAGDAFTAAMTHKLIHGSPLSEAIDVANRYAALVAAQPGAMPQVSPEDVARIGL